VNKLNRLIAEMRAIDTRIDKLLAQDNISDAERAEHDDLVAQRATKAQAIQRERQRLAREQQRRRATVLLFEHNDQTSANEPDWSTVDQAELPFEAYASGDPADPATWMYPHHWVEGGTTRDDRGILTDGVLYLHQGGLDEAWTQAQEDTEAPAEAIDHLQAHRDALAAGTQAREKLARERKSRQLGTGALTDPDRPRRGPARPNAGLTIPAMPRRCGVLKHFRGHDSDRRAYRFGMFNLALLSWQMPGRYRFRAAMDYVDKHMAAHESSDTAGTHYLIPEEFAQDLIDLREQFGLARRLLRMEPMRSDTKLIPRRTGGLTAYWVGEDSAGTESNANHDQVRLVAKDLMAIARLSNQVAADDVTMLGDRLMGEASYAFANAEDLAAFNGDGTSTYGGVTGVRTKLDNIDGAGTDSFGLVTQGTGNTWPAIVLADFDKVVGRLPQYADTPNCVWTMHRTFYYEVVEKLIQASGGVPAYEVREGRRQTPLFKGYPVEFSQVFPNATAVSQVCCVLGDLSLAAAFGDRQQEALAYSEHATIGGESVFERNQVAMRLTERIDIVVHDAGSASVAGPVVGLKTGA
jgi:HK97 family phage major capsid protein